MTPAIRPIRFSALKTLDPLDEEEKRGENHDRQPDIDEVEHGALQGFLLVYATWPATRSGGCGGGWPARYGRPAWGGRRASCGHFSGGGQGCLRPLTDSVKPQETVKSPVHARPMRGPCGS